MLLKDRNDAGRRLAILLSGYKGKDAAVYAIPRGGVILGAEIASHLDVPLDLVIPRKVGHPYNPEYAICAVTETGPAVCNQEEVTTVDPAWLEAAMKREKAEIRRRREKYLGTSERVNAEGKTAILVDDGIATGLTMYAAIRMLKSMSPKKVVVAVPVLPSAVEGRLREEADELVSLAIERNYLGSVSAYYEKFDQVEDDQVIELMRKYGSGAGY